MMSNQQKGLYYEKYVRDFIKHSLNKNSYLWNECPENILIDNNLICSHNGMRLYRKDLREGNLHNHKDIGIDVIQIEENVGNTETDDGIFICSMVQCKNGYSRGVTVENISGIMIRTAAQDTNAFIYYTDKLSSNVKMVLCNSRYAKFLDKKKLIEECTSENYEFDAKMKYFVKLPIQESASSDLVEEMQITPYAYQTDAVDAFNKHFVELKQKRGILSLPCGCGKTFTSYLIAQGYEQIVILSPLRAFADQNLKRYIEYGYDETKTLLVDSDGERNIFAITKFIKDNPRMLISTTYKSMDIISLCLDIFNKDRTLFIIDEFHNLTKANINDNDNPIFKLLMSDHRILFMSATPRIYEMEDEDEAYDMEFMFGKNVYNMSMNDAISNKNICDYRIWLPSIHENNVELDRELSIYEINNELKNRCKYLFSCLANNGSRKCIVYSKDTKDMNAMIECMKTLNEFYVMDIEIHSICCEDSELERKTRLEKFSNPYSNKIHLMFNIKILNECIDVPACDAVYISYPPKNKITTIQRICRANRTVSSNPYKIANIYIWCDEYEEIFNTLSSIKEFDCMFKNKIKLNTLDFYNSREKKDIDEVANDKILLNNITLGIKEYKNNNWEQRLQELKTYIEVNGKIPSSESDDLRTKQLGRWNLTQKQQYRDNTMNINKRPVWEAFIQYHSSLYRSRGNKWDDYLCKLEQYITTNNAMPSCSHKSTAEIKQLGKWATEQKRNYDIKAEIMQFETVRNKWKLFTDKYPLVLKTRDDHWNETLARVEEHILQHKKLPTLTDLDGNAKTLAKWLYRQNENYKSKQCGLENEDKRKIWEDFVNKHQYRRFMTQEQWWLVTFNELKTYVRQYNEMPHGRQYSALLLWVRRQKKNYTQQIESMKNESILEHWKTFMQEYPHLF
jgi:superfamily II DNA or RNA helicase